MYKLLHLHLRRNANSLAGYRVRLTFLMLLGPSIQVHQMEYSIMPVTVLNDGLLLLDFRDTIHEGDSVRIMHC